jgi:hypothetical protein
LQAFPVGLCPTDKPEGSAALSVISIPNLYHGSASRLGDDFTFVCSSPSPASEVVGTLDGDPVRFLIGTVPGMSSRSRRYLKASMLGPALAGTLDFSDPANSGLISIL